MGRAVSMSIRDADIGKVHNQVKSPWFLKVRAVPPIAFAERRIYLIRYHYKILDKPEWPHPCNHS